jgi:hypothetical protein
VQFGEGVELSNVVRVSISLDVDRWVVANDRGQAHFLICPGLASYGICNVS